MAVGGLNASCVQMFYKLFSKNVGIGPLSRHIKRKHPEQQPRQAQISILGDTLGTFTCNMLQVKFI